MLTEDSTDAIQGDGVDAGVQETVTRYWLSLQNYENAGTDF